MLVYPKEIIEAAEQWMEGNKSAELFLKKSNCEELVQLKDAVSRWPKAFEFLLKNKHFVLATFVNAIWEDKQAFKILMDKKEFNWAAMANIINGDDKAAAFLQKSNMKHYADLAFTIQRKIQKEGDEGTSIFSGPFSKS